MPVCNGILTLLSNSGLHIGHKVVSKSYVGFLKSFGQLFQHIYDVRFVFKRNVNVHYLP